MENKFESEVLSAIPLNRWDFLERRFTKDGVHPFDEVKWEKRNALILGFNKKTGQPEEIFRQDNVEFPSFYSQNSVNIVTQKYFRGKMGTPARETSLKQVFARVANTITSWGVKQGYFTKEDAEIFSAELMYILLYQMAAFNSPVWFNVGVTDDPQCSGCFINSVDDSMDSILSLAVREGNIFKKGSGAGSNLSKIRGSKEQLSGGGYASGPVSFMRGWDAMAGAIKSGGKTRRAAKMIILNSDHPDLEEFIKCKAVEEDKARALLDAGLVQSFDDVQNSVFFQNANNSVRASDAFMKAAVEGKPWQLKGRVDPISVDKDARELLMQIAKAAHSCGDPGMQFDDTINKWHTAPFSGKQEATNPCSEYLFLNDSACNLASINLVLFRKEDGTFNEDAFDHVVDIVLLSQEIIVSGSSYPTEEITKNSRKFRTLGLGYTNLGLFLALMGYAYDSDEARFLAAGVTASMHARAIWASAEFAKRLNMPYPGIFDGVKDGKPYSYFEEWSNSEGKFNIENCNWKSTLDVIRKHTDAAEKLNVLVRDCADLYERHMHLFEYLPSKFKSSLKNATIHGTRNAQWTLLAPTGTISFLMDAETTGIEPNIGWTTFKQLAGGGSVVLTSDNARKILANLGYSEDRIQDISTYVADNKGCFIGAPHISERDISVFDTALGVRDSNGNVVGYISPMGHLKMMQEVQPFLSGAISKTVNVSADTTPEEIFNLYVEAWKRGIKCLAIYRDGSKAMQPLSTSKDVDGTDDSEPTDIEEYIAVRWPLPDERPSVTHKFQVGGIEGYLTVGMYPDTNRPGEVFISISKEGSLLSGTMDAFATSLSLLLQHGIPLEVLIAKFKGLKFEPNGFTGYQGSEPELKTTDSIIDYIFKWMDARFLKGQTISVQVPMLQSMTRKPQYHEVAPTNGKADLSNEKFKSHSFDNEDDNETDGTVSAQVVKNEPPKKSQSYITGDTCPICGNLVKRTGTCKTCTSCGENSGCG